MIDSITSKPSSADTDPVRELIAFFALSFASKISFVG